MAISPCPESPDLLMLVGASALPGRHLVVDTGGEGDVSVRAWEGRARAQALAYVKRLGRARRSPCVICEQAIDYSLKYPHLQSCSVQHLKSRRDYPELTWSRSNWAPAHLDCNKRAGAEQAVGLGLSTSW